MVKARCLKVGKMYRCLDVKDNALWVIKRLDKEGNYITVKNTIHSDCKIEVGTISNIFRISDDNEFVLFDFNEYVKLCK